MTTTKVYVPQTPLLSDELNSLPSDIKTLVCDYWLGPMYLLQEQRTLHKQSTGGRFDDTNYWIPNGTRLEIWHNTTFLHHLVKVIYQDHLITTTWNQPGVIVLGHSDGSLTIYKDFSSWSAIVIKCPDHANQVLRWIFPSPPHGFCTITDNALTCWCLETLMITGRYKLSKKRGLEPTELLQVFKKPKYGVCLKQ
jgi:hypothetical protein